MNTTVKSIFFIESMHFFTNALQCKQSEYFFDAYIVIMRLFHQNMVTNSASVIKYINNQDSFLPYQGDLYVQTEGVSVWTCYEKKVKINNLRS